MKKILTLTLSSSLLLSTTPAQTIPGTINYQARITDANGLLIGSTGTINAPVAAPVNRKIRFRIYDVATGGGSVNRKWSEEQTVTVSLGEISVLLGDNQGTAISGEDNPASFASVFTNLSSGNSVRYLGITVDNGNSTWGAEDVEVTPRQQITPTGFAFRSKVAESLASGSVSSIVAPLQLVGSGTSGATGIFQAGSSSSNAGLMLRDNAGAEKAFLATVGASGSISTGSQSGDTVLRTAGGNKLILQTGSGAPGLVLKDNKLGIGNSSPMKPLHIGDSNIANTESLIRLSAKAPTGTRNRDWDVGVLGGDPATDTQALSFAIIDVQHGTTPALMVQVESGNVGIGTGKPEAMLDVRGGIKSFGSITAASSLIGENASVLGTGGYVFKSGGDLDGGLFSPGDGIVTLQTNGLERLRINGAGNVGIGTNSPNAKLDIAGSLRMNDNEILLRGGSDNYAGLGWYGGTDTFDTLNTPDGPVLYGAGGGALGTKSPGARNIALVWGANGNVGVGGTASDEARLVVSGTGSISRGLSNHQQMTKDFVGGGGSVNEKASIYANGPIHAQTIRAFSDARIKVIQGRSDSAADLGTLMNIAITNYTYKDTFTRGSGLSKKVIAQDLEKVFPQAVQKITDVVPDIFKKSTVSADGWVSLDTDLKAGERVRLAGNETEEVHEVLEVAPGKFRTAFKPEDHEVFVYGREVKDFRTVDYDAISMLNVSATQQLKREKDEEIRLRDVKITELESRLAQLASHEKEQESRLERLEKALAAGTTPASGGTESGTRTASR